MRCLTLGFFLPRGVFPLGTNIFKAQGALMRIRNPLVVVTSLPTSVGVSRICDGPNIFTTIPLLGVDPLL